MHLFCSPGLLLSVIVLTGLAVPATAQNAAATPGPAVTATVTAPAPPPGADDPAAARRAPEPNVQRIVSEDDNVRIDELRVRGQTREIVVQHKALGGSRYEILPGEGGRDPSSQDKRGAGQRVWRLFSF
jgi:hypothetical protein